MHYILVNTTTGVVVSKHRDIGVAYAKAYALAKRHTTAKFAVYKVQYTFNYRRKAQWRVYAVG